MVGGFLGAGKTTALLALARLLSDRGERVGLITNDQASGLVDTLRLRSQGYAVEEIAGGCFCCRFPSLLDAANKLDATTRPDVILAEPVGSCTDLVATVSYPLRRIYGERFSISPLSVLVDPVRAGRVLALVEGRRLSAKVEYIYRKQLEEAQLIVINKADLLAPELRQALEERLREGYPRAEVRVVSGLRGDGVREWLDRIESMPLATGPAMSIDYVVYGAGEALLGWLNATVHVDASDELDGNELLTGFAGELHARVSAQGLEVAHLKATFTPDDGEPGASGPGAVPDALAQVSIVRGDGGIEVVHELPDAARGGTIVVNLRAEGSPEALTEALHSTLKAVACSGVGGGGLVSLALEHCESFRPGQPVPTHRCVGGEELA